MYSFQYNLYSYILLYTASQCWLLARFLPIIIGDLIEEEDEHWENFLQLHDILMYTMAPCFSPASIAHLASLIEHYHQSFDTCYPSKRKIPKMHYMLHFPEQIRR